jgi:hypothetical protein
MRSRAWFSVSILIFQLIGPAFSLNNHFFVLFFQ